MLPDFLIPFAEDFQASVDDDQVADSTLDKRPYTDDNCLPPLQIS